MGVCCIWSEKRWASADKLIKKLGNRILECCTIPYKNMGILQYKYKVVDNEKQHFRFAEI